MIETRKRRGIRQNGNYRISELARSIFQGCPGEPIRGAPSQPPGRCYHDRAKLPPHPKGLTVKFEQHQKILFIGDSITDCGRRDANAPFGSGYVNLVRALVTALAVQK